MKTKLFFLISTIVTFSLTAAAGQNGKKYFKAGQEFVENLKYDDAVAQYTSALGVEPSNSNYYIARAGVYEKMMKYDLAKADYEKSLVFEPKNADAMVNLGAVLNKMANYDEALRYLNRASAIDRRNGDIYPEKVITLIGLERYVEALKVSDTALIIKDTPMDYYYRGICYMKMNNEPLAKKELEKSISKDKKLPDPRLALAMLLINSDRVEAMNQCNEVLKNNDRNTEAYLVRSRVYKKNLDYPHAIDDLSKNILIDPSNSLFYLERGLSYQEFNQHTNAINDFSKYISLKPGDPDAYFARAKSYEEISGFDKAVEDYNKITSLSEFDMKARKMLKEAKTRLYEINRETVAPEIIVASPNITDNIIEIKGNSNTLTLSGKIKEKSIIDTLLVNDKPVLFGAKKNDESEFIANVDVTGKESVTIVARDEYNNIKTVSYNLKRTEIDPPAIAIMAPYTSAEHQVFLDEIKPVLFIEGKIEDASMIKSIEIDGVIASYRRDQLNPSFTANIEISNINKFTVMAEDIYGNRKESEFVLNRDNALLLQSNPMGKTWVVFIENSGYETFASLDGPTKDISTINRALANYQIANTIHMKDMTKAQMEKFFNIELRDLIKTNQVKSLLVWYAGHGKFINDIGYWIPVDAKRDDEFTYFNINALKAGLQAYTGLTHTLVISDACESGPSFYTATRAIESEPTCDNVQATAFKSAQVFSSAGYELAVDNSQFSSTFANTLTNNRNACVPIETIVKTVTSAVANNIQQKPKFGKISGLPDENGTFFFIAK
jgi:tetratricopeptide (TPR) repeat protein